MKTDRFTYEGVPTPCYIIEEDLLRRNLELIRDVSRRAGVEIILAFKAFALWKSFPVFREYISHTTASSLYEARLAAEEFGSKAHTYSPAYTERDFDRILSCSSHVTFNSMSQYVRFYPRVEEYNRLHPEERVSCGLRINPEYSEIEVDLYNPCAPGSRFGMMASQLPYCLPAGIEGFHCHCHCESSSEALEHTLQHIEEKFGRWLSRLKWLNLGGGHLMTRKDYENFDFLIGMDSANIRNMTRIVGGDEEHKIYKMLSFADYEKTHQLSAARDVADPWYTGDFDATYDDILRGCRGLLAYISGGI